MQSMLANLPVEIRLHVLERLLICDASYSVAVGVDILCPGTFVLADDRPRPDYYGAVDLSTAVLLNYADDWDGRDLESEDMADTTWGGITDSSSFARNQNATDECIAAEKRGFGSIDDNKDDEYLVWPGKASSGSPQHSARANHGSESRHKSSSVNFVVCQGGNFRVSACPLEGQILRVCRKFYNEGIDILYGRNRFLFESVYSVSKVQTISASSFERIHWAGFIDTGAVIAHNVTHDRAGLGSLPGASQVCREMLTEAGLPCLRVLRNLRCLDLFFSWRKAFKDKASIAEHPINSLQFACAGIETTARVIVAQLSQIRQHNTESRSLSGHQGSLRPPNTNLLDLVNKHLTCEAFEMPQHPARCRSQQQSNIAGIDIEEDNVMRSTFSDWGVAPEPESFGKYSKILPANARLFLQGGYRDVENKRFNISRLTEVVGLTYADEFSIDKVYAIRVEPLVFRDAPPGDEMDPEDIRRRLAERQ